MSVRRVLAGLYTFASGRGVSRLVDIAGAASVRLFVFMTSVCLGVMLVTWELLAFSFEQGGCQPSTVQSVGEDRDERCVRQRSGGHSAVGLKAQDSL